MEVIILLQVSLILIMPIANSSVMMMQDANFQQRLFKLKVAEDTYQDETRIKVSIRSTDPLDFVKESEVSFLLSSLLRLLPLWQLAGQQELDRSVLPLLLHK